MAVVAFGSDRTAAYEERIAPHRSPAAPRMELPEFSDLPASGAAAN
jgi:hypothetical protein